MTIVSILIIFAIAVAVLVLNNRYNNEQITRTVVNVVIIIALLLWFLKLTGLLAGLNTAV